MTEHHYSTPSVVYMGLAHVRNARRDPSSTARTRAVTWGATGTQSPSLQPLALLTRSAPRSGTGTRQARAA
jgi:hypothetical protein